MKAFFAFLLPVTLAMQVKDIEHQLSATPDFYSLEENLVQLKGQKIGPALAATIRGFLRQVNETIFNGLLDDYLEAQKLIDDASAALTTCGGTRNSSFDETPGLDVWDKRQNVNDLRDDHDECKTNQTGAGLTQAQMCSTQNNSVKHFKQCGDRNDTEDSIDVYNWMHCLEELSSNCSAYAHGRALCENATANHTEAHTLCHTLQTQFEASICTLWNAINDVCTLYEGCIGSANSSFASIRATVEDMEALFKAQMFQLQKLNCLGDGILNNFTNYSICDDLEQGDCLYCDALSINYGGLDPANPYPDHVLLPCDELDEFVPNKPCSATFIAVEYAAYDTDLMADCTPCPP